GEMWRRQGDREEIVPVDPGVCITIPVGTHFQFRSFGYEPLAALGVTIPPWPGEGEAYPVEGKGTPAAPRAAGGPQGRAPKLGEAVRWRDMADVRLVQEAGGPVAAHAGRAGGGPP